MGHALLYLFWLLAAVALCALLLPAGALVDSVRRRGSYPITRSILRALLAASWLFLSALALSVLMAPGARLDLFYRERYYPFSKIRLIAGICAFGIFPLAFLTIRQFRPKPK